MKPQFLDNSLGPNMHGVMHFWFSVDDRKIAYCDVRKNACSAFRRFICETSAQAKLSEYDDDYLAFLKENHRLATRSEIEECDERIFVYRDPYERLVSLYVNKFVSRDRNQDIFRNFQKDTHIAPDDASFRDFVVEYCDEPFNHKDPHIKQLAHHLARVKYTWAIPISELSSAMNSLLGPAVAEKYFSTPANSTSYGAETEFLVDQPSRVLWQRYVDTGELPSKRSMLNKDLESIVMQRYRIDYDLIAALTPFKRAPLKWLRNRLSRALKHG